MLAYGEPSGKTPGSGRREKKILWCLCLLIVLCLLLWILFAPGRGFFRYQRQGSELHTLLEENHRLEAENAALNEEIRRLQSDDAYLEKVAREKYGLLKKDESVYQFPQQDKKKKD